MAAGIRHVFVLMLENRSFDHMLGFSGIAGTDASSGRRTPANGLNPLSLRSAVGAFQTNSIGGIVHNKGGKWPPSPSVSVRQLLTSNAFDGDSYSVTHGADFAMPVDPGHEFSADPANKIPTGVLQQLCGAGAVYPFAGAYPRATNTGFVASYAASNGGNDPGRIMKCYDPGQLPVLNALAGEFAVCDNWHASMPGPTWPNRFFSHAASSGGLDHSPSASDIAEWDSISGFSFPNGTVFDRMNENGTSWRLYAGDNFPIVAALKGIDLAQINDYHDFVTDVANSTYSAAYTLIEPSYGHFWSDYKCGTSEHPLDDITRGEALIKSVYEAVRNSPLWPTSLIIVTWDEHGGFYDHLPPPAAVAPGDTTPGAKYNAYGFTFQQFGPRVPAVVISPLIPANIVDHRLYDHSSILATIEACFGLRPLTRRDATAANLTSLASLATPRSDAPAALPAPAQSGVMGCGPVSLDRATTATGDETPIRVSRTLDSIDEGNLPGFLFVVLRSDLALAAPGDWPAIRARFGMIRTRADAASYITEVRPKVRAVRNARSLARSRPNS